MAKRGDEEPATRVGNDDAAENAEVEIRMPFGGGAYFAPAGMRRATPAQRRIAAAIQDQVGMNIAVLARLDELVDEARALRMSWNVIGWLTGMTAEGARKRWSDDDSPTA